MRVVLLTECFEALYFQLWLSDRDVASFRRADLGGDWCEYRGEERALCAMIDRFWEGDPLLYGLIEPERRTTA